MLVAPGRVAAPRGAQRNDWLKSSCISGGCLLMACPEFAHDVDLNDPPILVCPECSSTYLHHQQIEIFQRQEDATAGLHVKIHKLTSMTDQNLVGNPSGRRSGLRIEFWCEECQVTSVLSIAQHKGQTFVTFEPSRQASPTR